MSTRRKSTYNPAKAKAKRVGAKEAQLADLEKWVSLPVSGEAKKELLTVPKGRTMTRALNDAEYVSKALGHQSITGNDATAAIAVMKAHKKKATKTASKPRARKTKAAAKPAVKKQFYRVI